MMPVNNFRKLLLIGYIVAAFLIVNAVMANEPYRGHIPDPVQTDLAEHKTETVSGEEGDVELTLLAEYVVEGVVKGTKKYADYPSQVAKYDFALAWGDLNKSEIDEHIKYSQSGRWCHYQFSPECHVDQQYISTHSANVHLIHQNQEILRQIKKVRKNDHVQLGGYLVEVHFKDGPWKSSLTRTDTGNGACEIMYVTRVTVKS
jgi:hypothetical protein